MITKDISMSLYLSELFCHLHDNGVKYFLLTDFEGDFTSHDVDIYVHPNSKLAFEEAIFELGWYRRKEPAFHTNHYFYYLPKSEIYLDVKFSLTFARGSNECFTYSYSSDPSLDVRVNSKGVLRPQGIDAIMLYAAHLAYRERGKLEEKHIAYLTQYVDLYRNELESLHEGVLEQIQSWLLHGSYENTEELQSILSPYFAQERKQMTRTTGLKYGYGLNVLFLGTDGAGKTTLVEAVGSRLNIKNNKLYLGAGEDSWSSPIMKKIYNYKFNVKPLNKVFNFLKTYAVLPLEYALRIMPVLIKSKYNITLIDRFPGFVYLDKKPGRRFIYKSILPRPDLVFFLYASPEVIVKRKPNETTLERSRSDIKRFQEVAGIISEGNYKSIDTSELTINEARDMIVSEIFNHPKLYSTLLTKELCKEN